MQHGNADPASLNLTQCSIPVLHASFSLTGVLSCLILASCCTAPTLMASPSAAPPWQSCIPSMRVEGYIMVDGYQCVTCREILYKWSDYSDHLKYVHNISGEQIPARDAAKR